MPSNTTFTLYLGSGIEGQALLKAILEHCEEHDLSVSEYVKALIQKDLKNNP